MKCQFFAFDEDCALERWRRKETKWSSMKARGNIRILRHFLEPKEMVCRGMKKKYLKRSVVTVFDRSST